MEIENNKIVFIFTISESVIYVCIRYKCLYLDNIDENEL